MGSKSLLRKLKTKEPIVECQGFFFFLLIFIRIGITKIGIQTINFYHKFSSSLFVKNNSRSENKPPNELIFLPYQSINYDFKMFVIN